MDTRYMVNSQGHPITYFQDLVISSCYHIEEREKELDMKLVNNFPHSPRELLKSWYKPGKLFKSRPSNEYPTNMLRLPYQYAMAMIYRIYREPNAQKFKITWVPFLDYVTDTGSTFN
jgi:hypothetical protein